MSAPKNDKKRSRTEAEIAASVAAGDFTNPERTSKKQRTEERRSLFVRSLPSTATSETLADYFSQYFPVKHATVVTDKKTNESKGFGFVTFADAEDASQAKIALDKKLWDGKNIRIEVAEPRHRDERGEKKERPDGKRPGQKDLQAGSTKLIVRNLPWSIKTSDQLSKLFLSYGKIKFADLPQNKGKLKGFGFVTLRGRKNAEKALEGINGTEIDGRSIAVDWAVDKNTWEEKQQNEADEDEDVDMEANTDMEEGGTDLNETAKHDKPKTSALDEDLQNFMKNHMQNMEDESDEDEDETDDELDRVVDTDEKSRASQHRTTDNSSTIFIRNLPFTATDEQLKSFFSAFGNVRYARVVMDKVTEKPAGTGFVCFFTAADAKICLKGAPLSQQAPVTGKHSILQDENADPDGKYTMEGRLLSIAQAVNKETANTLAESSSVKRREKDKRRLFLLNEGHIGRDSPLFNLMSQQEMQMRQASNAQRKKLVQGNPSLHISLARLALRNIPRNVDSKELKELARKAIVGFAQDVNEGRRQPLSKEENARDGPDAKEKERERRLKRKGIVRQAKVVFESTQGAKVPEQAGAGKSRGYGFLEYTSHHWALMGLRYLNGLQLEGDNGRKQRLIVEFAIENAQVVQRRRANEVKSGQGPQEKKTSESKGKSAGNEDGQKTARVLKENKEARGKKNKKDRKGKKDVPDAAEAKEVQDANEGSEAASMKHKLIARTRLMRKKKARARS